MYLIGKKRCPTCGIRGRLWKKEPEIFRCPMCNGFFNEFGIILETQTEKEDAFTLTFKENLLLEF